MSGSSIMYSVAIVALIAVLTYGARLFPFILFSRGGHTPKMVTYLGNVLPPAVILMLIVYCVRNTSFHATTEWAPEFISIAAVVILYKLTKNNLIAMVGGTLLYMVLVQTVFV